MNVYTSLLFLQGYLPDPRAAGFGPSYGNRVANDRLLRERWEGRWQAPLHGREDDIDSAPKAA